jgi:hypothetical protein
MTLLIALFPPSSCYILSATSKHSPQDLFSNILKRSDNSGCQCREYEHDSLMVYGAMQSSRRKKHISHVRTASIIGTMVIEAVRSSETSLYFYTTIMRHIEESCVLYSNVFFP